MKKKTKEFLQALAGKVFGGGRPDFIIVGAQKSGTTSLFDYLSRTPGMIGSTIKEVHYFDREDRYALGHGWYESHFLRLPWRKGLFFEASPSYLFREKVPQRLKAYKPDVKIIILLREPVSRAYSAWNMYRHWAEQGYVPPSILKDQNGNDESPLFKVFFKGECPSFSEYVDYELNLIEKGYVGEEPGILRRGVYKPQLERYERVFGKENILVVGFSELKNDAQSVVKKCHDFLGVSYFPIADEQAKTIRNKRPYTAPISDSDLERLRRFYEKPNSELHDWLGYNVDW